MLYCGYSILRISSSVLVLLMLSLWFYNVACSCCGCPVLLYASCSLVAVLIITLLFTQSNVSRKLAQVEEQLGEAGAKIAEYEVAQGALQTAQSKLQSENNDLNSQLVDAESKNGSLSKANANLSAQLDEAKSELEMEASVSRIK